MSCVLVPCGEANGTASPSCHVSGAPGGSALCMAVGFRGLEPTVVVPLVLGSKGCSDTKLEALLCATRTRRFPPPSPLDVL